MIFEKTIPLNKFITLQRGFDLPKDDRIEGSVPVIASTGIGGYHNEGKVQAPGVVIGRSGSIGGGQYITENFWPLNTTLWVKDFKGHHQRYVYYLLKSIDFQQFNVGSGVPTLNRNHLGSVLVADIGYDNEKRIAEIIGKFDDKIKLNRQINQTLEQIAQAIFKSWFVDFEPVKAKIAAKENGQDPERAAMCAISGKSDAELNQLPADQLSQLATTATLFPGELVESERGLIPKGWKFSLLSKHCEILNGHAFKSNDYAKEGIFVFRTKNFSNSGYSKHLSKDVYLPEKFSESHSIFLCKPFDFHVVMVAASIGKKAIIFPHHLPALRNQNMWCFRAKNDLPSKIYWHHTVSWIVEKLLGWASGSARSFFRKGDFQSQTVLLPNAKLLTHFENIASSMLNQISINDYEADQLSNLCDTLLPKLLSGEISVAKTQTKIEAAV